MLSRIFKKSSQLNAIEKEIVDAIACALPPDAGGILRNQVALINKVQRLDHDREVDFYHIHKGKPVFPDSALFPERADEFELARVHVTDIATGRQADAVVSLVRGHLFCIEFDQTPRDLRSSNNLKIEIKHLRNPMSHNPEPQA